MLGERDCVGLCVGVNVGEHNVLYGFRVKIPLGSILWYLTSHVHKRETPHSVCTYVVTWSKINKCDEHQTHRRHIKYFTFVNFHSKVKEHIRGSFYKEKKRPNVQLYLIF